VDDTLLQQSKVNIKCNRVLKITFSESELILLSERNMKETIRPLI
jgi:hypothetical protein